MIAAVAAAAALTCARSGTHAGCLRRLSRYDWYADRCGIDVHGNATTLWADSTMSVGQHLGTAKRISETVWEIGGAGRATRTGPGRWRIANRRGTTVAIAVGADGEAVALVLLTSGWACLDPA